MAPTDGSNTFLSRSDGVDMRRLQQQALASRPGLPGFDRAASYAVPIATIPDADSSPLASTCLDQAQRNEDGQPFKSDNASIGTEADDDNCGSAGNGSPAKNGDDTRTLFPYVLHQLLEDAVENKQESVVSWNGANSFKVHDRETFTAHILPRYFRQTRYKSFVRQLNLWGYHCIDTSPERGSYHHEFFQRHNAPLCSKMKRVKIKGIRRKKTKVSTSVASIDNNATEISQRSLTYNEFRQFQSAESEFGQFSTSSFNTLQQLQLQQQQRQQQLSLMSISGNAQQLMSAQMNQMMIRRMGIAAQFSHFDNGTNKDTSWSTTNDSPMQQQQQQPFFPHHDMSMNTTRMPAQNVLQTENMSHPSFPNGSLTLQQHQQQQQHQRLQLHQLNHRRQQLYGLPADYMPATALSGISSDSLWDSTSQSPTAPAWSQSTVDRASNEKTADRIDTQSLHHRYQPRAGLCVSPPTLSESSSRSSQSQGSKRKVGSGRISAQPQPTDKTHRQQQRCQPSPSDQDCKATTLDNIPASPILGFQQSPQLTQQQEQQPTQESLTQGISPSRYQRQHQPTQRDWLHSIEDAFVLRKQPLVDSDPLNPTPLPPLFNNSNKPNGTSVGDETMVSTVNLFAPGPLSRRRF